MLENLKPEKVFKYFEEICSIPHGSGNTKKISDYIASFAKERGYKYIQDDNDNVVIYKAASVGYEASKPVIIQGHIDMVCEKTAERNIDFLNEGLSLKCDGNVVYAEGTTLGGDDGIAVAYMLAILDSQDVAHPALECVFTSDEEIGLLGASALDCSVLEGRMLLNIDSEVEGQLLTSCAGGASACCELEVDYEKNDASNLPVYCVKIDGVTGGHSGVEINKQGANAVKLLGRALWSIAKENNIRLVYLSGGNKDNAIPRMAYAHIVLESADKAASIKQSLSQLEAVFKAEYKNTDKELTVSFNCVAVNDAGEYSVDELSCVMDKPSTNKVLAALAGLPNGIIKYSQDIENLVQTSLNLGVLKTKKISSERGAVSFSFSVRSSVETEKNELIERMECLVNVLGGKISVSGAYPAWEFRENSRLRETMVSCYEKLYGKKPEIIAIHAGLECGIFSGKMEGLDCVSFGPDIKDIHTTEEKLYVDSVERTWNYIVEVLKNLK